MIGSTTDKTSFVHVIFTWNVLCEDLTDIHETSRGGPTSSASMVWAGLHYCFDILNKHMTSKKQSAFGSDNKEL